MTFKKNWWHEGMKIILSQGNVIWKCRRNYIYILTSEFVGEDTLNFYYYI